MNPAFRDTTALPLIPQVASQTQALHLSWGIKGAGAVAFVAAVLAFCFADSTKVSVTSVVGAPVAGAECQSIGKVSRTVDLAYLNSPVYQLAAGGSGNTAAALSSTVNLDPLNVGFASPTLVGTMGIGTAFTPLINSNAPFCAANDFSTSDPPPPRTLVYDALFPTYNDCLAALVTPPSCAAEFGQLSGTSTNSIKFEIVSQLRCNITSGITLAAGPFALTLGGNVMNPAIDVPPVPDLNLGVLSPLIVLRNSTNPLAQGKSIEIRRNACTQQPRPSPEWVLADLYYSPFFIATWDVSSTPVRAATVTYYADSSCSIATSTTSFILTASTPSRDTYGSLSTYKQYGLFSSIQEANSNFYSPTIQVGRYPLLPEGSTYPSGCAYDLNTLGGTIFLSPNKNPQSLSTCAATAPTNANPSPAATVPCTLSSLLASKYSPAAINNAVAAAFTPEYVCAPFKSAPPYLCIATQRQSGLSIATQSFSLFTTVVAGLTAIVPYLLAWQKRREEERRGNTNQSPFTSTVPGEPPSKASASSDSQSTA